MCENDKWGRDNVVFNENLKSGKLVSMNSMLADVTYDNCPKLFALSLLLFDVQYD